MSQVCQDDATTEDHCFTYLSGSHVLVDTAWSESRVSFIMGPDPEKPKRGVVIYRGRDSTPKCWGGQNMIFRLYLYVAKGGNLRKAFGGEAPTPQIGFDPLSRC